MVRFPKIRLPWFGSKEEKQPETELTSEERRAAYTYAFSGIDAWIPIYRYPAIVRLNATTTAQRNAIDDIRGLSKAYSRSTLKTPVIDESATSKQISTWFDRDLDLVVRGYPVVWTLVGSFAAPATGTLWGEDCAPGLMHHMLVSLFSRLESVNKRPASQCALPAPPIEETHFVLSISVAMIQEEEVKDLAPMVPLNGIVSKDGTMPRWLGVVNQDEDEVKLSAIVVSRLDHCIAVIERIHETIHDKSDRRKESTGTFFADVLFGGGDKATRILDSISSAHILINFNLDCVDRQLIHWNQMRHPETGKVSNITEYRARAVRRGSLSIVQLGPADCLELESSASFAPSHVALLELIRHYHTDPLPPHPSQTQYVNDFEMSSALGSVMVEVLNSPYPKSPLSEGLVSFRTMFHVCLLSSPPIIALGFLKFCEELGRREGISQCGSLKQKPIAPTRTFFNYLLKKEAGVLEPEMLKIGSKDSLLVGMPKLAQDQLLPDENLVIKPEGIDAEIVQAAGRAMLAKIFKHVDRYLHNHLEPDRQPHPLTQQDYIGAGQDGHPVKELRKGLAALQDARENIRLRSVAHVRALTEKTHLESDPLTPATVPEIKPDKKIDQVKSQEANVVGVHGAVEVARRKVAALRAQIEKEKKEHEKKVLRKKRHHKKQRRHEKKRPKSSSSSTSSSSSSSSTSSSKSASSKSSSASSDSALDQNDFTKDWMKRREAWMRRIKEAPQLNRRQFRRLTEIVSDGFIPTERWEKMREALMNEFDIEHPEGLEDREFDDILQETSEITSLSSFHTNSCTERRAELVRIIRHSDEGPPSPQSLQSMTPSPPGTPEGLVVIPPPKVAMGSLVKSSPPKKSPPKWPRPSLPPPPQMTPLQTDDSLLNHDLMGTDTTNRTDGTEATPDSASQLDIELPSRSSPVSLESPAPPCPHQLFLQGQGPLVRTSSVTVKPPSPKRPQEYSEELDLFIVEYFHR